MAASKAQLQQQLDAPGLTGVSLDAAAITVSDDTADPAGPFRALWVGVAGNIKLNTIAGNDVTFTNVPVGVLPVACTRVWLTGTGVTTPNTNIVGLR